jgi:hypothetical protein
LYELLAVVVAVFVVVTDLLAMLVVVPVAPVV